MKRKWWLVGVLIVVLLAGLAAYVWLASPLAGNFSPPGGASDVPVRSAIQISFNEPMQPETVEQRLSTIPARSGSYSWQDNTLTFTPDAPWPGGSLVQVRLEAGGRARSGLGLPLLTSQSWSFTTAQALLVYLWPSDGPADLYALDPLSGEIHQLTWETEVYDYSISQDGLQIFFSAPNAQLGSDLFRLDVLQVLIADSEQVEPTRVLSCQGVECRAAQLSPDGRWLAYERIEPQDTSGDQVWLMDLTTQQTEPLSEAGHVAEYPRWSTSSLLVYYDQQAGYVFHDLQTGGRFVAPNSTGQGGSWAPDGTAFLAAEIVYINPDGQPTLGSSHLIRYTPFGTTLDLTGDQPLEDASPTYSPSGETIAFGRKYLDEPRWTFGRQLWLMNADGSDQRQITQDGIYNHYDFAWSWDEGWLAYVRFDNASLAKLPELWLCEADGSNPLQLIYGGYAPQWLP